MCQHPLQHKTLAYKVISKRHSIFTSNARCIAMEQSLPMLTEKMQLLPMLKGLSDGMMIDYNRKSIGLPFPIPIIDYKIL
jgi:hypothetical protein